MSWHLRDRDIILKISPFSFSHLLGFAFGGSDFHQRTMVLQYVVFNVQPVSDSENQEQVCDL